MLSLYTGLIHVSVRLISARETTLQAQWIDNSIAPRPCRVGVNLLFKDAVAAKHSAVEQAANVKYPQSTRI